MGELAVVRAGASGGSLLGFCYGIYQDNWALTITGWSLNAWQMLIGGAEVLIHRFGVWIYQASNLCLDQ